MVLKQMFKKPYYVCFVYYLFLKYLLIFACTYVHTVANIFSYCVTLTASTFTHQAPLTSFILSPLPHSFATM